MTVDSFSPFSLLLLTILAKSEVICDEAIFTANTILVDGVEVADLDDMSFGPSQKTFRLCRVGLDEDERFEVSLPEAPRGELLFAGIDQVGVDRTRIRLHLASGGFIDLSWEDEALGWRAPDGTLYPRLALNRAGAPVVRPHSGPGRRSRLSALAH